MGIAIILLVSISFSPIFALSELERASIEKPRLENAFGVPITDNVNVNQQVQISADITNHQTKSQNFVYLVQIKDKSGFVVSLGWIRGQLTPDQKLNLSLSWTPQKDGEHFAEIFVWEALKNHHALSAASRVQVNVS